MARLLTFLLAAPVLGALVAYVVARTSERAARYLTSGAAASAATVAIALWFRYVPRGPEWQFTERMDLFPPIGVNYALGIDGLALSFIVLSALVAMLCVWSIGPPHRAAYGAMLVLEAGLLGTFVSLDLLLHVLFWTLAFGGAAALLASVGVSRRLAAGLAVAVVLSAVLMLAGVLALDSHYRALSSIHNLDMRAYQQLALPAPLQTRVFLAFLPAIAMAPVMFFVLARTASGGRAFLLLPGVLVLNAGIYQLLRISLPILPDASRRFVPAMLWIAVVVFVLSAVTSVLRREWKPSIASVSLAYAALAALGALTLTLDGLTGAIVQHVALTLAIGAIVLAEGSRQFASGSRARMLLVVVLVGMLSLAGVPLLGGFVGLRRTVEGVWSINRAAAVVLAVGIVVAAIGLLRLYLQRSTRVEQAPDSTQMTVRPMQVMLPAVPALLLLWIGLYPPPLLNTIETAVARVVMRVSPQYAAEVADCLSQPATPAPAIPGLPAVVAVAPCADGAKSPPPSLPVK